MAHSTLNRNTLKIKIKLEDIFEDPGTTTTPDGNLSSHCVGLLALITEMHTVTSSRRMCVLINKILTYSNTFLEHKGVPFLFGFLQKKKKVIIGK